MLHQQCFNKITGRAYSYQYKKSHFCLDRLEIGWECNFKVETAHRKKKPIGRKTHCLVYMKYRLTLYQAFAESFPSSSAKIVEQN